MAAAGGEAGLQLLEGARQGHRSGDFAVGGKPVALVGAAFAFREHQAVLRQLRAEFGNGGGKRLQGIGGGFGRDHGVHAAGW